MWNYCLKFSAETIKEKTHQATDAIKEKAGQAPGKAKTAGKFSTIKNMM